MIFLLELEVGYSAREPGIETQLMTVIQYSKLLTDFHHVVRSIVQLEVLLACPW